ncbi:MAG: cation-translocating P-type ATPase [Candidatus Paceibacterota bacterium]
MDNVFWHHLKKEEVLKILNSDPNNGLSSEEAFLRLLKDGLNELPEEKEKPSYLIFLSQFLNPLLYILIFAGILAIIFHDYLEGIFILVAVFINAFFGFFQENKAKNILSQIKKKITHFTTVLRDGHLKEIPQKELVKGDIIILKAGDKVPADSRIIESFDAKVNEAILTGEWLPSEKEDVVLKKETPLIDRKNMIFMGTDLIRGKIKAVVVNTGLNTELGKIGKTLIEMKEEKTPLQKRIAQFSKFLAVLIGVICFLIFLDGIINNFNLIEVFITVIAVGVSSVPEGLPVTLTIVLALGMQRILKNGGLIKNLSSVETLGSASVICMDKTGTLTTGEMKIKEILGDEKEVLINALLNSQAYLENFEQKENFVIKGDPEDKAILEKGLEVYPYYLIEDFRKNIILNLPFSSDLKYSASLFLKDNQYFLYVMGAPEKVLEFSSKKYHQFWEKIINEKIERGDRIIATAFKKIKKRDIETNTFLSKKEKLLYHFVRNLNFSGLLVFEDPLREEVKEAIQQSREASINPLIISGDHKKTVQKIAQEVGLVFDDQEIIPGEKLDQLSELELENQIENFKAIYRAEPYHKLKIIEVFQKKKKIVAMAGDGVNDALALKKADIGIALHSATEIAKSASDLVLLNDSFALIVKAIEEGRKIITNLRKIITYLLSDSFTEIILIGTTIFLRWPLPFLGIQVLWTNIIEDTLPAISLAFEEEKDLLKEKPDNFSGSLLTSEMKFLIFIIGLFTDLLLLFLFYFLLNYSSYSLNKIRTIIFVSLTIDSIFSVFALKSLRKNLRLMKVFSNTFLNLSVIFGFALLFLPIYFGPLQKVLKTVPLGFLDWVLVFSLGIIDLLLIEFGKWLFIRRKNYEDKRN